VGYQKVSMFSMCIFNPSVGGHVLVAEYQTIKENILFRAWNTFSLGGRTVFLWKEFS
jgi:hypothetical protein